MTHPTENKICRSCETVAHCSTAGCIPLQPSAAPDKPIVEGLMELAMKMAVLYRCAPSGFPRNCLAEYDAAKAELRIAAERLASEAALPLMRSGFCTAYSDGQERRYEVRFSFRSLAEMQAVYREWIDFNKTRAPQPVNESAE